VIPTFLKRKDGSIYINPVKRHVRPFWLTSQGPGPTPQVVAIPAGGTTNPIPYPVDIQGSFEIFYIMFEADDPRIDVNIFDPGTRRSWSNRPIRLGTIAGTATRPFYLPESYLLNTDNGPRDLQVTFTDVSGAPNNVRMVFYGRRLYQNEAPPDVQEEMVKYMQKKERTNVYFLTSRDPITIPPLGILSGPTAAIFEATDEADTEVMKTTFVADGLFTFQLRELRSNRTLGNNPIISTSGWGTGQFPFVFQETFLIERNYDVAFELTDLSGESNNVFPTMIARRLYYQ
jgi:hypothetical protein